MAGNAQSPKTRFHAYPMGVISDQRMNASHFRMLGAIAGHDRLNANGTGCYAAHKTLATEAALHPSNVPKIIDDLVGFGYLTEQPNPLNRRLRIYRVVYEPISGQSTADQSTVNPPEVNSVSGQSTVDTGPISGQRFGQVPDNKQELDVKHMLKANTKAYPAANPAEAAALRAALSDSKTLAAIEPQLQWGELVNVIAGETRFRPESVSEILLTTNPAIYDEISNRSTPTARRVELFQRICKECPP